MSHNKIYENTPEWPSPRRGVEMGIYGNSSVVLGARLQQRLPNDLARCASVHCVAGVAFESYNIMVDVVKGLRMEMSALVIVRTHNSPLPLTGTMSSGPSTQILGRQRSRKSGLTIHADQRFHMSPALIAMLHLGRTHPR
jgi:hypothetical protein